MSKLKPGQLVQYIEAEFKGTEWHNPSFYVDRLLHGQRVAALHHMLEQLDMAAYVLSDDESLQLITARAAIKAFVDRAQEDLQPSPALGNRNAVAVIREVL